MHVDPVAHRQHGFIYRAELLVRVRRGTEFDDGIGARLAAKPYAFNLLD